MKKALTVLLFACGAAVHADCLDGSRDTTDAEKQFYIQQAEALKASLPAAPAGWRLEDRTRISAPGSVCTGSGKMPIRVHYEVRYYWQDGIQELSAKQREFDKRIAEARAMPADKQKEYDETGRRGRDLERQARKLMATDKPAAEKMLAESKELFKQASAIREAHRQAIAPKLTEISQESTRMAETYKTQIKFLIAVNGYNFRTPQDGRPLSVPGAAFGFSSPEKTVVAYGAWQRQGSEAKAMYTAGSTTRVQTVTVEATGDLKQVETLLAGMNREQLATLQSAAAR